MKRHQWLVCIDNVFRLKNERKEVLFSFAKSRKDVPWSEMINKRPGLRNIKKGESKIKILFWNEIWI